MNESTATAATHDATATELRTRVEEREATVAELRERLKVTAQITAVLWDANATAAAAGAEPLTRAAQ